ncbi:hypothetical protein EEB15_10625 [Ramlibacter sp. WS9]|nr:hypothetical protein EEB15_10625 [Ramlibacter sp. WS9]
MEAKHITFALLVLVAVAVYVWDRLIDRKARAVRTSWNCIRCGVQLGPMESTEIRVAGGPHMATTARACTRCAKRDARVWWAGLAGIVLAIIATAYLLWSR